MKIILCATILFCICVNSLVESQITFSRTWVRGKYPGEANAPEGDDEAAEFVRSAKSDGVAFDDDWGLTRYFKPGYPVRFRSLRDVARRMKIANYNPPAGVSQPEIAS